MLGVAAPYSLTEPSRPFPPHRLARPRYEVITMPVAAQQPQPTRREPRRYTVVHVPPLLLHQRDRFQLGQRRIMQRLQPLVAAEGPLICALLAFDMHFAHR